jgi:tRNA pseudouridine38-40 synthase
MQAGVRTVQQEVDHGLQRIAAGSSSTVFAGRTDRGVHAEGQVVSADVPWTRDTNALRVALDAVTPRDVVVRQVVDARDDFHARYDARWREYRYRIRIAPTPPVLDGRFVWWRRSGLDDDAVRAMCEKVVGEHAFGAFAGSGWSRSRNAQELTRIVRECIWQRSDAWTGDGERVISNELRIVANGFLPQMVRSIVAAAIEVGSAKHEPEWVADLLDRGDRSKMVEPAPAHGLSLWRVEYDDDDSISGSTTHGEYEED